MFLILAYLVIPALIIFLCQRIPALDKLGTVVLAFTVGIVLTLLIDLPGLLPAGEVAAIQKDLSEISIALALPLLLFSIDIKSSLGIAGDTLKGMLVALFSVITMSLTGAFLFQGTVESIWQVAGMSVGTYTGGGPNIAAIKTAIEADDEVFVTMMTYDVLLSAVYLIFVMSIGQKVFGLFLKPYEHKSVDGETDFSHMEHMADESADSYKSLADIGKLPQTVLAILCSGVVVGLALGIASLVPESMKSTVTIISITTLGLGFSFIPKVRALANSFRFGMYLILVFCFAMGTMIDSSMLVNLDYSLIAYISYILGGALILQSLLCKVLGIDTDTFLITSSAAIMSVPFIAVIAGALKNREILLPGFAVAIIGYVVGNYLGILVANVSKWMVGA